MLILVHNSYRVLAPTYKSNKIEALVILVAHSPLYPYCQAFKFVQNVD